MHYILALLAALFFTAPASAGTYALYSEPGGKGRVSIEIEVADNGDMRIGRPGSPDYLLVVGGVSLAVSGKLWAARLTDFAIAYDKMVGSLGETFLPAPNLTIEKRGPVVVKGRPGTTYSVKGLPETAQTVEFVMSADPALVPVGRALDRLLEASPLMAGPVFSARERSKLIAQYRRLMSLGTPIGGRFRLEAIRTTKIDPRRLAVPGRLLTADELAARLSER